MTDKQQFIEEYLKNYPDEDFSDALDAWKLEIKYINQFYDWDKQIEDY